MSYISLDKLYKIFSPKDVASLRIDVPTQSRDIYEILKDLFLNPNCVFFTHDHIKSEIKKHFTPTEPTAPSKEDLAKEKKESGKIFHVIGPSGFIDLDDKNYWSPGTENCNNLYDMIPSLLGGDYAAAKENFTSSAYILRSPFVNPSTRGTDKIDMFLNSIPTIVASQMVPYLDVEFKIQGASSDFLNSPSSLRFLLGSVSTQNLSSADRIMKNSEYGVDEKNIEAVKDGKDTTETVKTPYSMTGMEQFLMPQTLTNMESLGPSAARLVKAKPFLPFASILSFDVNVVNAGSGKFSHKKGTLKFAVHDKARLGEMAEFIRGSSGFNQVLVWTTYGWLAPMNRGDEDEYASFINKNMMSRECWQVVNSQFSFDASGQVSLSLELVSKAAKLLQEITISELDGYLREFHKVIQTINELRVKASGGENKFSISVQSEQILNAGSTNGVFTDIKTKDLQQPLNNLIKSLKKSALNVEELSKLETNLKSLMGNGNYSHSQVETNVGTIVKNQFDKLRDGPDPFLASFSKSTADQGFFSDPNLYLSIQEFNKTPEQRKTVIKGTSKTQKPTAQSKTKNVSPKPPDPIATQVKSLKPVVSFGKIFLYFLLPAVAKSHTCNEIQVFFYGLNDQCGPVSGQSIAEFPINVATFAYAYAEFLKTSGTEDLNLEIFMRLLIETQFSDHRAIGYGMNSFYKPWDKDNPNKAELSEDKKAEDGMAQWLQDYGSLKLPMIEMYVETSEEGTTAKHDIVSNLKRGTYQQAKQDSELRNQIKEGKSPEKKLIKRIHIYDKQCNPYRLMQSIIRVGDNLQLGQIDTGKVGANIKSLYDRLDSKQKDELDKLIAKNKAAESGQRKTTAQLLQEASGDKISQSDTDKLVVKELPYGREITIPKDRDSLKAFLMRNVPSISIGTNGTLVTAANVASKTDSLMGSINIINANKSQASGKATLSNNSLEEAGGLPLRSVPMQVTMTTLGVPTSQLYQTFFLDFNTGTTIDNIYNCTQLQHSISPGKFMTNWTFAYTDGYGKFSSPPTEEAVKSGQLESVIRSSKEAAASAEDKKKKKKKK